MSTGSASGALANDCVKSGSILKVSTSYNQDDFGGNTYWTTKDSLPTGFERQLNGATSSGELERLLADRGAVKSKNGLTILKLVIQGKCKDHVVIRNMRANISARSSPYSGGCVSVQAGLGVIDAQGIAFDLDRPSDPPALAFNAANQTIGGSYFANRSVDLDYNEVTSFEVFGITRKYYIEWAVTIDALVGGEPQEIRIMPGGKAIKSTALTTSFRTSYLSGGGDPFRQSDPSCTH